VLTVVAFLLNVKLVLHSENVPIADGENVVVCSEIVMIDHKL